jgi:hypothetical protein
VWMSDETVLPKRSRLGWQFRTYPSLRPACLRSAYAADNPIAIRYRIASERDGRPGSPLRHSSMSCCHSSPSRKLTTGVCPIRGRRAFFRITTFESDMQRVLQQSAHTENPVYATAGKAVQNDFAGVGLPAASVGSWRLLLLLRPASLGALRWLRRAAPYGLQRLFLLRSTAVGGWLPLLLRPTVLSGCLLLLLWPSR